MNEMTRPATVSVSADRIEKVELSLAYLPLKTPISDARLKGEEISFTVGDTQYVGRVNGNAMSGETKGPRPGQWKATRLGYDH